MRLSCRGTGEPAGGGSACRGRGTPGDYRASGLAGAHAPGATGRRVVRAGGTGVEGRTRADKARVQVQCQSRSQEEGRAGGRRNTRGPSLPGADAP